MPKENVLNPNTVFGSADSVVETHATMDRDVMYSLLSSRRRRNVLHALVSADGQSTVSHLARQLAAWETGKAPADVSSKERKRTYTALRQTHLPKLAQHEIVEYDVNRGTVSLTEVGEELRPYLWPRQDLTTASFRWELVAILSSAIVAALSWLGVQPFDRLGGYALVATVILAYAVVSAGTYLQARPAVFHGWARRHDTEYVSSVEPEADD